MSESRIPMEHLAWALGGEEENPNEKATQIVQTVIESFGNDDPAAIGGSLDAAWKEANNGNIAAAHAALSSVYEIIGNQVAQLEQLG